MYGIIICDELSISIFSNIIKLQTENQNPTEGRFSGVMMWPGSEFTYNNREIEYIEKYDK